MKRRTCPRAPPRPPHPLHPAPRRTRSALATRDPLRWRSATVPASTSNLGPGFDCLGLALNLPLVRGRAPDSRGV